MVPLKDVRSIQIDCEFVGINNTNNVEIKIYPNPNTGTFSVAFNSDSGEAISVNVHDIQGRQILSKQLANTGNVSEVIALPNVQVGIYLVTVQDGNKKEVKRVIVQ